MDDNTVVGDDNVNTESGYQASTENNLNVNKHSIQSCDCCDYKEP